MTGAFVWGAIASSSLVLGALLVMWRPIGQRALGLVMAFGAGVLISAVSFELVADAVERGAVAGDRHWPVEVGLGLGALTFYAGDRYIDRMGGERRKRSHQESGGPRCRSRSGSCSTGSPSRP